MIPSLEFKHSRIYEETLLNLSKKPPIARLERPVLLNTFEKLKARKDDLTKLLEAITALLKVNWSRQSIRIYVLSFREHGVTFSDPLTVPLCDRKGEPTEIEYLIDLITHELIHNALVEMPESGNALKKVEKDFPGEPEKTHVHILVHAAHYLIYKKIRGLDRFEKDKQKNKDNPPYARAWQIVEEQGPEKLLETYLRIKVKGY